MAQTNFIVALILGSIVLSSANAQQLDPKNPANESEFCRRLEPVGRILEEDGYFIWCCSPIYGPDGRVHVFYSRWPVKLGFDAWLTGCEVAHAVADKPEGPYVMTGVVMKGRGPGFWDGGTIHNPTVHKVGKQYAMFYLGTEALPEGPDKYEKTLRTKRIGLAVAGSLDGPWKRVSDKAPLLEAGPSGAWDDMATTNPAFLQQPDGKFWLYYKSWNIADHVANRGVRKYGLAVADRLEGRYVKNDANPIIDLTKYGPLIQCEDAYIWRDVDDHRFKMIMRDMSFFGEEYGLLFESNDGIHWPKPLIGYKPAINYFKPTQSSIGRNGRIERPQLLLDEAGRPAYLFGAMAGGRFGTSTAVVLKVRQ